MFRTGMINGETIPTYYADLNFTKVDSIDIQGNIYYDVVKFANFVDTPGGLDCNEDFMSAKRIGLIQHTTCYENKIWNLIDYHINE